VKFKRQQLEDKMGLDMYLNAKRYMWHNEEELSASISENFPELGNARFKQVVAEYGYWRKANAIHKWFVDNVQKGVDDCGSYEVSKEQLESLLELVEQVLAKRSLASKLLPTTSGFFFGETKYEDYYFEDLEYTRNLIKRIVDAGDSLKDWEFEYTSSW
jgi:hypothetical protein